MATATFSEILNELCFLVLLHTNFDKMAKSMRIENAIISNCKAIILTNQKMQCKVTTAVNLDVDLSQQDKKVLLPDIDVQANLAISFGYGRPDDLSDTPSSIMQNVIDDNPRNALVIFPLPYLGTSMIWQIY